MIPGIIAQQAPVAGGDTGTGNPPTVKGAAVYAFNANTYNANFPAGTAEGDLCVIATNHAWDITSASAGWVQLNNMTGINTNGATFYKILTASDITTGYVTITYAGSYNGCVGMEVYEAGTFSDVDLVDAARTPGTTATEVMSGDLTGSDCWFVYGGTRANAVVDFSLATVDDSVSGSEASASVGNYTSTGDLSAADTVSFTASGNGIYASAVVVHGAISDGDYTDTEVTAAWGVAEIEAIYSLRKTVPEYAGPVVKGRRVSDGATKRFYPTDSDWIDVAEVATWAGSSDVTVASWYDQSANALHMEPAFANPPLLAVAGVVPTTGGNPAIMFGTAAFNTKTRLRAPFNLFQSSHTVVLAGQKTSSSGTGEWGSLVSSLRSSNNCITYGYASSTSNSTPSLQQNGVSDSSGGTTTANGTPKIFGWKRTGVFAPSTSYSVDPYVGKTASTTLTLNFNSNTLVDEYTSIGGAASTASDHMNGLWSEFVFHLTALSDTDRVSIEDVMSAALGY